MIRAPGATHVRGPPLPQRPRLPGCLPPEGPDTPTTFLPGPFLPQPCQPQLPLEFAAHGYTGTPPICEGFTVIRVIFMTNSWFRTSLLGFQQFDSAPPAPAWSIPARRSQGHCMPAPHPPISCVRKSNRADRPDRERFPRCRPACEPGRRRRTLLLIRASGSNIASLPRP